MMRCFATVGPRELTNIDRVAAGAAKRVLLLNPPTDDSAKAAADLRSSTGLLMELQAGVNSKVSKRADVVVSAPPGYHNPVASASPDAFGSYAEVSPDDFVSRVLAQCAVQPGLSHVYDELLLQGAGSEATLRYSKEVNGGHRGTIRCEDIRGVVQDDNTLDIYTPDRTYHVRASSEQSAGQWATVIRCAAAGAEEVE